jgi:hypothetical protein
MDLTCSSFYAAFQGDVFLMLDIKRLIDVVIMVFVAVVVGIMMMALLMIEFLSFFLLLGAVQRILIVVLVFFLHNSEFAFFSFSTPQTSCSGLNKSLFWNAVNYNQARALKNSFSISRHRTSHS